MRQLEFTNSFPLSVLGFALEYGEQYLVRVGDDWEHSICFEQNYQLRLSFKGELYPFDYFDEVIPVKDAIIAYKESRRA
jgi:hypothetical protein